MPKAKAPKQPSEAASSEPAPPTQQPEPHENDVDHEEESELNEKKKAKERKHDSGAADLERVTDYAEEREISASDISGVMGLIGKEVAGRQAKEVELMKVQIKKEDVQLIVTELEVSPEKAEQALREHGGNLMETLVTLTD